MFFILEENSETEFSCRIVEGILFQISSPFTDNENFLQFVFAYLQKRSCLFSARVICECIAEVVENMFLKQDGVRLCSD